MTSVSYLYSYIGLLQKVLRNIWNLLYPGAYSTTRAKEIFFFFNSVAGGRFSKLTLTRCLCLCASADGLVKLCLEIHKIIECFG